ncbi:Fcf2 pre-rRNA processing [Dictyocaulus viviparus]|uniref:Fcf2 pre-rRNA processing n=1 Tax=Dictyocaulus viviparus TaxID=29172 RepID=A0A0D8X8E9_DICVI|nr:Fcf2 pre-rRNA processing [Dictyocaulus viviparus]
MLLLKKRPLLTKSCTKSTTDSDDENDTEGQKLPILSKDPLEERGSMCSNDICGDFFVLDSKEHNQESFSRLTEIDSENMKPNNVEQKSSIYIDEDIQKLLDKAVCGPSFEKNYASTAKLIGSTAMKRLRKREREKTKGRDWFDLPATELTDEIKNDLELLQMRNAVDPLAFYRRNDRSVIPKYFQASIQMNRTFSCPDDSVTQNFSLCSDGFHSVGRIVDAPEDFYSSRMTKKERKRTMLDELLCDKEFVQSKIMKFKALQEREKRKRRGAFQQAKSFRHRKQKHSRKTI